MKKQYTKKQIQEAIAYWEKQLAKGNYRRVDESLDKAEFQRIKNRLMDELEAHGPVAVCKKLHTMCRELASDPDWQQQYEDYKYVNQKEPPRAKDIVLNAIEQRAFFGAGGTLNDMIHTVDVDNVQYKGGTLRFDGTDRAGRRTSVKFGQNGDGTWGMRG